MNLLFNFGKNNNETKISLGFKTSIKNPKNYTSKNLATEKEKFEESCQKTIDSLRKDSSIYLEIHNPKFFQFNIKKNLEFEKEILENEIKSNLKLFFLKNFEIQLEAAYKQKSLFGFAKGIKYLPRDKKKGVDNYLFEEKPFNGISMGVLYKKYLNFVLSLLTNKKDKSQDITKLALFISFSLDKKFALGVFLNNPKEKSLLCFSLFDNTIFSIYGNWCFQKINDTNFNIFTVFSVIKLLEYLYKKERDRDSKLRTWFDALRSKLDLKFELLYQDKQFKLKINLKIGKLSISFVIPIYGEKNDKTIGIIISEASIETEVEIEEKLEFTLGKNKEETEQQENKTIEIGL